MELTTRYIVPCCTYRRQIQHLSLLFIAHLTDTASAFDTRA
jgi:hypothetical protein